MEICCEYNKKGYIEDMSLINARVSLLTCRLFVGYTIGKERENK